MIVAAILLGVCQIITMLGGVLLLRRLINAKQAELEEKAERALRDWVESPEAGKPSKLAVTLDAAGAVIGSAAARSLMASLKQDASAQAHVANGMVETLQAQQNPVLGLLAGGKRGKGAAVMRLAELLGPMLAGAGKGNGATSEGRSVHDRLQKGS